MAWGSGKAEGLGISDLVLTLSGKWMSRLAGEMESTAINKHFF